jgi:hypothetical protein
MTKREATRIASRASAAGSCCYYLEGAILEREIAGVRGQHLQPRDAAPLHGFKMPAADVIALDRRDHQAGKRIEQRP